MQRQAAVARHVQIITECISEASTSLFEDKHDGLDFIKVAETFYKVECPVSERQAAMKIFRATTAALRCR